MSVIEFSEEYKFVHAHKIICQARKRSGHGGAKAKCARHLYASIIEFGLDPIKILTHQEFNAATVKERAMRAAAKEAKR